MKKRVGKDLTGPTISGVWWFSSRPSAAKEAEGVVLLYVDRGRRRQRAGIGEKHHTPG